MRDWFDPLVGLGHTLSQNQEKQETKFYQDKEEKAHKVLEILEDTLKHGYQETETIIDSEEEVNLDEGKNQK